MNHPPIPPNCEFFRQSEFGDWDFICPTCRPIGDYPFQLEALGVDDPDELRIRKIIAAVSQEYWNLEWSRQLKKCGSADYNSPQVDEASDAMSAWRKWSGLWREDGSPQS